MGRRLSSLFVFWIFVACFSQAQSLSSAKGEILPLLADQQSAANAHDTDRFLATYWHDAALVFVENGVLIRGWDDLHDQQLKWWKNGTSDVVYTERHPPEFIRLGPQCVLVTLQVASHRTMPDGKPRDGRFVVTTIWHHLPAGWRVTYGHESWER